MNPFSDSRRLSLNQMTVQRWTLREAVEGCLRAGIPSIGVWRDKVAELGLAESNRLLRASGLHVSSLCRGGWFPASTRRERDAHLDDNRRAVEEAAELGADVLILVCGPAADHDLAAARAQVQEALVQLVPYAVEHGVKLGIEPLHPMFVADRSVIVTLAEANHLVSQFDTQHVGVVIDAYHVWWDPDVYAQIAQAAGHIFGLHVSDWLAPPPDVLLGRGMMGDGVIELRRLRSAVDAAGYTGSIEVEIFNQAIWDMPGDDVLALMQKRFIAHV